MLFGLKMYRLEAAPGGISKASKKKSMFFFLRTSLREMCCFFAFLKNKHITNDLKKEFSTWEVEAKCLNVVRVLAFQMF